MLIGVHCKGVLYVSCLWQLLSFKLQSFRFQRSRLPTFVYGVKTYRTIIPTANCFRNMLFCLLSDEIVNPLNAELNPICYLLALLGAHHFLHVSRIRVKSLTFRLLMSCVYIYIYIYIYMEHPFLMFLDHTQRHTTGGRTPLDE